ncbi:hypothetical protein EMIT0P294_20333 [Pseudomonas sp. IT-P294]
MLDATDMGFNQVDANMGSQKGCWLYLIQSRRGRTEPHYCGTHIALEKAKRVPKNFSNSI